MRSDTASLIIACRITLINGDECGFLHCITPNRIVVSTSPNRSPTLGIGMIRIDYNPTSHGRRFVWLNGVQWQGLGSKLDDLAPHLSCFSKINSVTNSSCNHPTPHGLKAYMAVLSLFNFCFLLSSLNIFFDQSCYNEGYLQDMLLFIRFLDTNIFLRPCEPVIRLSRVC